MPSSLREALHKRLFYERFEKRECIYYKEMKDDRSRCQCGRKKLEHKMLLEAQVSFTGEWNMRQSTRAYPTDAYGIIEFQGDPRYALKAHFVRLSFDTDPRLIMKLFEDIWDLERPKMVISVHSGVDDFRVSSKMARAFQSGLMKAAKTTGAWVITTGLNAGATQYVANALAVARKQSGGKNKIVAIGIAPWGVLRNANEFAAAGAYSTVYYHPRAHSDSRVFASLNDQHSYFLLADNGTFGRYGAEMVLRRRFEEYLSQQLMTTANKEIPMVAVVLNGGVATVRQVLDYLTYDPPIPIVACDGTGGAADWLYDVNKHMTETESMYSAEFETSLKPKIKEYLKVSGSELSMVYSELKLCGYIHKCITGFRLSEDVQQDIDHPILTALLTRTGLTFADRLSLVLAWKRADVARTDVFVRGHEWLARELDNAMMEALVYDRVDFVDLLLQNGCSMEKFLTVNRLEDLYNTSRGPSHAVFHFMMKNVARRRNRSRYTMFDVGVLLEKLIGGSYMCPYTQRQFGIPDKCKKTVFPRPFNDLLIWAVLTNRKDMAICFWQHGEDALAKSLVAAKLYKECAEEIAENDVEQEVILAENAKEFERLSVDLLSHCYQADDDQTFQLLTYELRGWPGQTCLGLAVSAENMQFVSQVPCQILLTDLWHGGMRIRKYGMFRVLFSLLIPFMAWYWLDFKSKGELTLQAQKGVERKLPDKDSKPGQTKVKDRPLTCCEKVKEFLAAPITTFWIWTLSYLIFLGAFVYFMLVALHEDDANYVEYYIVLYTFTYGLEMFRRFLISESRTCWQKLAGFCRDLWQVWSLVAIVAMAIAFGLRTIHEYVPVARVMYALIGGFWCLRLLTVIEVNSVVGSYLVIITNMLFESIYIVAIMLVTLMAYGVQHQSLVYQDNRDWDWQMLRNVTYKPYFMWYGEVFPDDRRKCVDDPDDFYNATRVSECTNDTTLMTVISNCTNAATTSLMSTVTTLLADTTDDNSTGITAGTTAIAPVTASIPSNCTNVTTCFRYEEVTWCPWGSWFASFSSAVYMMITNIILLNLLIAMFNHIYTAASTFSMQVWKFKRYYHVMEYEQHPFLPPPFVVFYHVYAILQAIRRCCCKKCCPAPPADYALKLVLKGEDVENLLDFEEECMEDLAAQREKTNYASENERLGRLVDRLEFMSMKLDEILSVSDHTIGTFADVSHKLYNLDKWLKGESHDVGGGGSVDELTPPFGAFTARNVNNESTRSAATIRRMSAGASDPTTFSETVTDTGRTIYGHKEYTTILDGLDLTGCMLDDSECGYESDETIVD